MAVKKGYPAVRFGGTLGRSEEVIPLKADIPVNVAIVRSRQYQFVEQGGSPLSTTARAPNTEEQVLLAVFANQVGAERVMDLARHGHRPTTTWLRPTHSWEKRVRM